MTNQCIKLVDKFSGNELENIKIKIMKILDTCKGNVTNKRFTYFFKKDNVSKMENIKIYFLQENIMHLLGIQRYHALWRDESASYANKFYEDYLSNEIVWENIWIKSNDKGFKEFKKKLQVMTAIGSIKEPGVSVGGNGGLMSVRFDNVLYAKHALGIGIKEGTPVSSFERNLGNGQTESVVYRAFRLEIHQWEENKYKLEDKIILDRKSKLKNKKYTK